MRRLRGLCREGGGGRRHSGAESGPTESPKFLERKRCGVKVEDRTTGYALLRGGQPFNGKNRHIESVFPPPPDPRRARADLDPLPSRQERRDTARDGRQHQSLALARSPRSAIHVRGTGRLHLRGPFPAKDDISLFPLDVGMADLDLRFLRPGQPRMCVSAVRLPVGANMAQIADAVGHDPRDGHSLKPCPRQAVVPQSPTGSFANQTTAKHLGAPHCTVERWALREMTRARRSRRGSCTRLLR
jgi:hypothetical protein